MFAIYILLVIILKKFHYLTSEIFELSKSNLSRIQKTWVARDYSKFKTKMRFQLFKRFLPSGNSKPILPKREKKSRKSKRFLEQSKTPLPYCDLGASEIEKLNSLIAYHSSTQANLSQINSRIEEIIKSTKFYFKFVPKMKHFASSPLPTIYESHPEHS